MSWATRIWQDPASQRWQTRRGVPVRERPRQTRPGPPGRGRRSGPVGRSTSTALEQVIPADVGPGDIHARLGAVWIPAADHQQFLAELLDQPRVRVYQVGATWTVEDANYGLAATSEWGIPELPAGKTGPRCCTSSRIVVNDYVDDKPRAEPDQDRSPRRRRPSSCRPGSPNGCGKTPTGPSGSPTTTTDGSTSSCCATTPPPGNCSPCPGWRRTSRPLPHQRAAVARMIPEPAVGLFHEVGAGKTAEMVIGAMELRRLGLIRKPAIVVPEPHARAVHPRMAAALPASPGPGRRQRRPPRARRPARVRRPGRHRRLGRDHHDPHRVPVDRTQPTAPRPPTSAVNSTRSRAEIEAAKARSDARRMTRQTAGEDAPRGRGETHREARRAHDPGLTFETDRHRLPGRRRGARLQEPAHHLQHPRRGDRRLPTRRGPAHEDRPPAARHGERVVTWPPPPRSRTRSPRRTS